MTRFLLPHLDFCAILPSCLCSLYIHYVEVTAELEFLPETNQTNSHIVSAGGCEHRAKYWIVNGAKAASLRNRHLIVGDVVGPLNDTRLRLKVTEPLSSSPLTPSLPLPHLLPSFALSLSLPPCQTRKVTTCTSLAFLQEVQTSAGTNASHITHTDTH